MYAQRIQLSPEPPFGSGVRLTWALLLSVNLHLYFAYGLAPGSATYPRASHPVLQATIELMPVATQPVPVALPSMVSDKTVPARLTEASLPKVPLFAPPRFEPYKITEDSQRAIPMQRPFTAPAVPRKVEAPVPGAVAADTHTRPSVNLLPVESPYFGAAEIDRYPKLLRKVNPARPLAVSDASGVVTLQLLIDESGAVSEASVANADPPGVFDESAVEAYRLARFSPAQKSGENVRSRIWVKVRFVAGEAENSTR